MIADGSLHSVTRDRYPMRFSWVLINGRISWITMYRKCVRLEDYQTRHLCSHSIVTFGKTRELLSLSSRFSQIPKSTSVTTS